ncbi:gamma-glutamyltransferase family protein [Alteribacillus iranensis]|uniref:Gamma-glutamyltranspeptidase / glutathione hydrolase n=1 Tax=Alteribacillus iranensis TaxID=930128 RepID=A0A1I2E9N9_9BACI|nr:gamma-glutamyltransferase family protein [Alteribacillus iranensis]SFE89407.1 gamma-glutamyltranspeptidase / glutathione hydrolase [Alteribacillus iranensis]
MRFDPLYNPHTSQRMTTYARNGMVATSQPLASQAGIEMLKKGGNAIDAAIATAAALTVLEPTSNGIGGDAFALVYTGNKLHGLNASGAAPQSISIESLRAKGYKEMPNYGLTPVTVPGAPGAWVSLSDRFGSLPFSTLLEPAIEYAEQGYPLTPILGFHWQKAYKQFCNILQGEEFESWFDTFAPTGRAPEVGEIWSSKGHARTLKAIAETKGEDFYKGEIAEKIDKFSKKHGGFLSKLDLAMYQPEWVDPIKVNYRGFDIWEIPPNGQGLVALLALNLVKEYKFKEKDSIETYHRQIEALKLAFSDGLHYITDSEKMKVKVEELLSDSYANRRRKLITHEATLPQAGQPVRGGTVYLATADRDGNMVSFIQSNYKGFGSGIVIPGTGISLQNRGQSFSLDPSHSNSLEPGKKTYHTIIPGFITKDDKPIGPFGVMGGFIQPQAHFQVVMNSIDFHLNPQTVLDAPRWQWIKNKVIEVEPSFPDHIAQGLARKGHEIYKAVDSSNFGRGQIIWRDPSTGVLAAGTESRTDGSVAVL